jgi:hypothetical protein
MKNNHIDQNALIGIYDSRQSAENAVHRLKTDGFSSSEISVLLPENGSSEKLTQESALKTQERATTGASTGLVIGGALGWLVGMSALVIPGVGPFIAAGPLLAVLAGAGTGAAIGGIAGGLIGMGLPEEEANSYENSIRNGGILLSVHTEDFNKIMKARIALEQTGARDLTSISKVKAQHNPKRKNTETAQTTSTY